MKKASAGNSRSRRRLLTVAASTVGLAGAGLVRCGGSGGVGPRPVGTTGEPRPGGTLHSLLDEEPATLDPVTPGGGVGNQLGAFVYSRLVRFKAGSGRFADGTLEGDLAAGWEQPDPTTLIFRLRDGVRFDARPPTSGRALTGEDVVLTWQHFAERGTYRTDLANAAGKDAPIISLRDIGERAVALTLAFPDAQLLPTLASRFGLWVMPREAFNGGFDPRTEMRGSGPWMLTRWRPSLGFSFARNPNYYAAPTSPLLDGVELPIIVESAQAAAQFRAGNLHGGPALGGAAVAQPEILDTHRDLKATRIDLNPPPLVGPTLAFGWRDGSPFRDVRVRRAVSMLIDRDAFIEVFTNLSAFQTAGVSMQAGWTTPLSPGWGAYWLDPQSSAFGPNAASFRHNVAEAKRLLAAAGYPDGFETPFTFITESAWGRDWSRRGEVLMAMLAQGGIRCRSNPVRYNAVFIPEYLRRAGDFDGIAMQRTGSRGDPGQFWSIFFSSAGASNQVGRNFPELDAMIARQRQEQDPARRLALIHDLQRYFAEVMPAVPQGGHTEEPVLSWAGLHGPDERFIWGGGDLGAEAYPFYWLDERLRR